MQYQEYKAHPLLSSKVACYWTVSIAEPGAHFVLPDGCADIIFNFGTPLFTKFRNENFYNNASTFVVGNMTRAILTGGSGNQYLFGIRFLAGGLSFIMREPLSEFTDKAISLSDCTNPFNDDIHQRLLDLRDNDRVRLLDELLLKLMSNEKNLNVWQFCLEKIKSTQGKIPISILADQTSISVRQMERVFLKNVGLTPKQMCRVTRFCEAARLLESSKGSWESLAWDLGFTDQAHFTKSFKEFTGVTPSEFVPAGT